MECKLLFPKCNPVLSSFWVLSHALHADVAHVPAQVQEAWHQAAQIQYQEMRLDFDFKVLRKNCSLCLMCPPIFWDNAAIWAIAC